MRKIEWKSNVTPDQQELSWMREFVAKPFDEKFIFICKLQLMDLPKQTGTSKKGKRIEWI